MFQGFFGGSDPNTPNTFVQSPDQIANRQRLAQALIEQGTSTAPIASPWQGVANLAKALMGGYEAGDAQRAQRLGQANTDANRSNLYNQNGLYNDPGNLNIPATPGQTTPALQANDAANDAAADAQDSGQDPRAALAAALAKGSPAPVSVAPNRAALAAALAPAPAPSASANPMALAATLGAGTPYGTANVTNANASLASVNPNSRGMRNNNPGNLESNAWTQGLPGYAGTDGRFAIFNTLQAGQAALDHNLAGYGAKGIATPLAIASTWAPGSEKGNDPNSYGGAIAHALGVGPNDPVNMNDPATRAKIGQAIAFVENGPPPASGNAPAVAAINAATGGGGAPAPNPAQATGQGGDVSGILNMLGDPNASEADRQMTQQMLQMRLPQRPSIIEGPTDPNTGYPTKLIWSPTQGVLGRVNADGSTSPVGAGAGGGSGANAAGLTIPAGMDAKKYRETLAEAAAKEAAPTATAKLEFSQKMMERPSYKELASALPSYNAMTELIKDNTAGSTKAFVDAFGRVINPGASVRQGTFEMLQNAQSLPDAIRAEILKAYDGNQELSPDALAAMTNAAKAKIVEYQKAWTIDANQGTKIAKSNKFDPSEVIPEIPAMIEPDFSQINSRKTRAGTPAGPAPMPKPVVGAAAGGPAASPFPAPAIAQLKANPTPQMRAHFEEIFGPGSSAKALAQ